MMFSKSKRFPEGRRLNKSTKKPFVNNNQSIIPFPPPVYFAVGKEYIPGPGEYEVFVDDIVKHKRYGFISQTSRFPENLDVSFQNEVYDEPSSTTTSLSTDTRLSSTSSNRTLDENICRSRKSSLTHDSNTFEKYRYTMQKEIELLQSKGRKMEQTIQSLESSKNAVKTVLLEKDQELADMRAKNNALQKTVTRLEKSYKLNHLTKKIETLEEKLRSSQATHELQSAEKDKVIQELSQEVKNTADTVADIELVSNTRQTEIVSLKQQLELNTDALSSAKEHAMTQENQIDKLKMELEHATQEHQKAVQTHHQITSDYADTLSKKQAEIERLNDNILTLEASLASSHKERTQLQKQAEEQKLEIEQLESQKSQREQMVNHCTSLISSLQQQFKTYRSFMNQVVTDLRSRSEKKCDTHIDELNALMSELNEAKRFINKQAQQMDGLKSDQFWLKKRNEQLWTSVQEIDKDFQGRCTKTDFLTDDHATHHFLRKDNQEEKETALIDSGFISITDC